MAYVKIRPRRGTKAQWESDNPILSEGEMGIEYPMSGVGTGKINIKLGDGITPWIDLPYAIDLSLAMEPFKGATSVTDGAMGIVPKPAMGDQDTFLCGDGTWKLTPDNNDMVRSILDNETKAYITGTSADVTNVGTQLFDLDIYKEANGVLCANTFKGIVDSEGLGNSVPDILDIEDNINIKNGDNIKTIFGLIKNAIASLYAHIVNYSNPHKVTKAQVGLSNVNNTSDANKPISTATQTALNNLSGTVNNKVDKVSGKGLSTNDYTNQDHQYVIDLVSSPAYNLGYALVTLPEAMYGNANLIHKENPGVLIKAAAILSIQNASAILANETVTSFSANYNASLGYGTSFYFNKTGTKPIDVVVIYLAYRGTN